MLLSILTRNWALGTVCWLDFFLLWPPEFLCFCKCLNFSDFLRRSADYTVLWLPEFLCSCNGLSFSFCDYLSFCAFLTDLEVLAFVTDGDFLLIRLPAYVTAYFLWLLGDWAFIFSVRFWLHELL
jgi:hypothetical protein